MLKKIPRIGPPKVGSTSEGQFPKRTVSWSVEGFLWQADNAHGEKAVRYCFCDKLEGTRRTTSLGSKHTGKKCARCSTSSCWRKT